jgi:D-xylose 1-dehydrogenase (NADP+, D-xylono-1,5-lactone-forming)
VSVEPLRWGLLGTARINRRVIPPLRLSKGNRLVSVASRDRAKGEAYAREWGIERVHGSYDAMLADPDVDVVYVPLPNHLHAEWSIRAARAGKHVLCEKPLALSVEEVDAMEAAARESGVVLAEAFMYRHHAQTLKAKEILASGVIGEVRFVRGTFTFPLTRPNDVRLRPEWGGGSLWDVGCYPLSFTQFLLDAAPLEVFGSRADGPTGVDETFAGQLKFPNGVLAQVDCGFRSPMRAELEVAGTEGTLRVRHPWQPDPDQPILLRRGDDVVEVPVESRERFLLEIEDLEACVRSGRAPLVPIAESRRNVRTILALYESSREGRPIRL